MPGEENNQTQTTATPAATDTTPAAATTEPTPAATTEPAPAALTAESYGAFGLQIPEDKIDKDYDSAFRKLMVDNQVPVDLAQKIAQFNYAQNEKDDKAAEAMVAEWNNQSAKIYGDNLKNVEMECRRVLSEVDKSGDFGKFLALAGAEKHPATLAFLKAVGERILEKPSVNTNATAPTRQLELEDFYK